jgi:hypothetical protein
VPKPAKKPFINPLLQSSEATIQTSTDTYTQEETLPTTQTSTQTPTHTYTSTSLEDLPSAQVVRRKRGEQTFEKTHERFTSWMDKRLKAAFEQLVVDEEASKTVMLNEAIADLLRKHGR